MPSASGYIAASAVRFAADDLLLVAANLGWQQLLNLLFSSDFEFPLSFRARWKLSGAGARRQAGP
jgi:hypothetical protein